MKIYSIFQSINGEVNIHGIGSMCTFIRFAGCSCDCPYCDTTYAKDKNSGTDMRPRDIFAAVQTIGCRRVTITGGEPLEQKEDLYTLLVLFREFGYSVSVETNGTIPFNKLQYEAMIANWVVDVKLHNDILLSNYLGMNLQETDYIKMVVGDSEDFFKATYTKDLLQRHNCKATFAFSPKHGTSPNKVLAWMKKDRQMDAVLNFQAHKILNLDESQ